MARWDAAGGASSKTHHTVLALSSENWKHSLLGEVVEQRAVLLPEGYTQLKVLQSTERRQQLRAKLVRPCVQEIKVVRA